MPEIILRGLTNEQSTQTKFIKAQKWYAFHLATLILDFQQGRIIDRTYLEGLGYLVSRLKKCDSMRSSYRSISTHCHCPECAGIMIVTRDGRPGSAAVDLCKCRGCGRECDHCGPRQG